MTLVRVDDVTSVPLQGDDLWGGGLDVPGAGFEGDGYALDVIGWALGRRLPVTAVELMQAGTCLWRIPPDVRREDLATRFPDIPGAGSAGFFATLSTLTLERDFELTVRARLEDKTRVPIAHIRGSRAALVSTFKASRRPLMVTTLGRTGSTAFVRMLRAHPEIAAYRPFQYEPRVATYWMGVLRSLSEPSSYRRQLAPTGTLEGAWWLGSTPPHPRRILDPEVHEWLGGDAVQDLAAFCQSRIEQLYEQAAVAHGEGGSAYFAEKYRPDWVPGLMWELYPDAREVVLARDFRDMVSSMFAFNAKRGFQGFRRGRSASDADFIAENVGSAAGALARAWQARAERSHLVRYEDLIQRPAETAAALLDYLGLDGSVARIDAMLATLSERAPDSDGHRTIADPAASIGRWRSDLSAELQQVCEHALGPALRTFGYEPAEQAQTR